MPVDPMIADSMLGTFRNMYKECVDKNASGPSFDKMKVAIERMESLANEHSDFMAFQGQVMQENLMGNFSVYYGEVLGELSKPKDGGTEGYDDKALLEQSLNALRDAIKRIDEGAKEAEKEVMKHAKKGEEKLTEVDLIVVQKNAERNEPIKKAIAELIALGESCENLPAFLRLQIEKGMDKAAEGSVVVAEAFEEDALLNEIQYLSPYHIAESKEILQMYRDLESKAAFGVPISIEVEMERTKIEHKYLPDMEKWDKVQDEWKTILDTIAYWVASQCPRAPGVDPWVMIPEPGKSESIKYYKNCNPSHLEGELRIFKENHGYDFKDIFTLESFQYAVTDHRIVFSQEYMVHLVNVIYPQCKMGNFLPQEIIDLDMKFFNEKRMYDPDPMPSVVGFIKWFNNKYGEGMYEQRFSPYNPDSSNAAPWNYDEFLTQIKF